MKPSRSHVAGTIFGVVLILILLPLLVVTVLGLVEGYGYHQSPIYFGNYMVSILTTGNVEICGRANANTIASIPFLGNVLAFMASGLGTILCIAIPILLFALIELIRNLRLNKRISKKYKPEENNPKPVEVPKELPAQAALWNPEPMPQKPVDVASIAALAASYLKEEQEEKKATAQPTYMRRVSVKDIPTDNPDVYIIRKGKRS